MVDLDSADQRPGHRRRVRSHFISCQRSGFRRSMVALESLRVLLVIAAVLMLNPAGVGRRIQADLQTDDRHLG